MQEELDKSDAKFEKAGITERIINLLKEGKEEAEFSKMLATIRRDAPIDFVLPKEWHIDLNKVSDLFNELDFRTLLNRLKLVLGEEVKEEEKEAARSCGSNRTEENLGGFMVTRFQSH